MSAHESRRSYAAIRDVEDSNDVATSVDGDADKKGEL